MEREPLPRPPPLRNPDFLRLWAGQTVSLLGAQAGGLALPLAAAVALRATPLEMGLLAAAGSAPSLLVGLLAGPWVDRRPRRATLVQTNLARALLLASVPVAAALGWLGMGQLYAVAFAAGTLAVFFDVAYQSYLPALVGVKRLVDGNGKLAASASAAQVAGPGLAAFLIGLLGAPLAVAFNAATFAVSAAFLAAIRRPEPPPAVGGRGSVRREVAEGLGLVLGHRLLRAVAARNLTFNFFLSMRGAVNLLYFTRELRLEPGEIGLVVAAGGPAALVAAGLVPRVQARLGLGPTLVIAAAVEGCAGWLVAFSGGPRPLALGLLVAAQLALGLASTTYNVNQLSLRQGITPHRLLGRVNATMRFLALGASPLGALAGGWLGEALGLRGTLVVAAEGMTLGTLWVLLSPLRGLKEAPGPEEFDGEERRPAVAGA